MPSNRVLDELKVTAELCGGREYSTAAARIMAVELEAYPEHAVLSALARCRRECRTLSLADIVARIDDGHPGAEEAWAMLPHDEAESVVWTPEMREAFMVCQAQIDDGDTIGARMAFKETYTRLLSEARAQRRQARWEVSLGHDASRREAALREAVQKNRLTFEHAQALLPDLAMSPPQKLLSAPVEPTAVQPSPIKGLLDQITKAMPDAQAIEAARQAELAESARQARAIIERMKRDEENERLTRESGGSTEGKRKPTESGDAETMQEPG